MDLIPHDVCAALSANADDHRAAQAAAGTEPDPIPLVKLFSPVSAATWLATELDADGDTLFGLADMGFGCPELGYFSLAELSFVKLPFGLRIERDEHFASDQPLSRWADLSRAHGSILAAERLLRSG